MSDYTELVKALRYCQFGECGCGKCYYKELKGDWCAEDNHPEFFDCDDKLKLDAAAAIEALQAELEQKNRDIAVLQKCYQIADEAADKALKPKRGKWIGVSPFVDSVQCSECGYCIHSEELETPYCPWCGAKMENVNE